MQDILGCANSQSEGRETSRIRTIGPILPDKVVERERLIFTMQSNIKEVEVTLNYFMFAIKLTF